MTSTQTTCFFKNRFWVILAIGYLAFDFSYSFLQYFAAPLDGDIAAICLPLNHYQKILTEPFGFQLLQDPTPYSATNRYFSHKTMYWWFNDFYEWVVPFFKYRTNALYFISALFSLLIHIIIVGLLSLYVKSFFNTKRKTFLLAAVIITTFFQFKTGFYEQIGIIDNSITYTFFYALPMALLLIFFYPFFKRIKNHTPLFWHEHLFCMILLPILPFCGAITAGVILIICPIAIVYSAWQWHLKVDNSFKKSLLIYFILLSIWAIYSFYIGTFNIESSTSIDLLQRYRILSTGIIQHITSSYAFIIIGVILFVNGILLFKNEKKSLFPLIFLLAFITLYILILPLGGYKSYRPNIIRYDVAIPLSLLTILYISFSSIQILKILKHSKYIHLYSLFLIINIGFMAIKDFGKTNQNHCQRATLIAIECSDKDYFRITTGCKILTWDFTTDTRAMNNVSSLLLKWKITKKKILLRYETAQ